jgi:DNA polymerase-3 subunit delta'
MDRQELPARIARIIGHQRQVAQLDRIARTKSLPIAMVLSGPAGIGRKTLALRLAAAAICPNAVEGAPCGTCSICARVVGGSHPDVQIWSLKRQEQETGTVSKSAALTIETTRRLAASTALRPFEADRAFIIIEDGETLGDAAQQALLKTLEDAPQFVTIILIPESPGVLLDTVLSRCVHIPLQLVPTSVIAAAIDAPGAEVIARLAMGRPGWAFSALADDEWRAEQESMLASIEAWILGSRGERLIEAYIRGDRFARDRVGTLDKLDHLQIMPRDVLLTQTGATGVAFDLDRATRIAARFRSGAGGWHRALVAAQHCARDLTGNIRPRLAMQHMVNQWPTQ